MKISYIVRLFVTCALTLSLSSCGKEWIDCTYVVAPYVQATAEAENTAAENVIAHAFYADTAHWEVTSYDNAEAGILSSRTGEADMNPQFTAETDEDGLIRLGPLKEIKLILVVVDRDDRIYAWRYAQTAKNLETVAVSLVFKPWSFDKEYVSAKWTIVNETPPVSPPEDEEDEGA